MSGYYREKLSGARLKECYDLAPPRIGQYLAAEVDFVRSRISPGTDILELGCGYGRVMKQMRDRAGRVTGIDNAWASLEYAINYLGPDPAFSLLQMDAGALAFRDNTFDVVFCIQNGISAFGIPPARLMEEALRVTARGGRILFSSYAPGFWRERLNWFRIQAARGLLGDIDEEKTGNGRIYCLDGFKAVTVTGEEFQKICDGLGKATRIRIVDDSSLFCEVIDD